MKRLLAGYVAGLLGFQLLRGHCGSGIHGIFYGGEVGILQLRTKTALDGIHLLAQFGIFAQIALQFVAEGQGVEVGVAGG